ncbi:MAG: FG-GAP repeat domain-containing protein, partial [Vicinamibacteria bacterium]
MTWGSCGTADRKGTGDFDGDGLQDLYCQKISSGGQITVGISDGSSFAFTPWGGFCSGYDMSLSTGDYNGDGKTDWLCNNSAGIATVALSMGSYLSSAWTSGTYCNPVFQGDFNGDGKTDIGCHGGSSYNVDVRLSTGSGFA